MLTAEDTARRTPGLANVRISGQNVRSRLRESGLRATCRRPVVVPILKKLHRNARLAWARARRRWRLQTWQHIFFRFALCFSDGRFRVYRRRGECFTDQCVYVSDRFGGESVMVWAGIFHGGRTQLKIVQGTLDAVKYRDDILDPTVLSFLQQRNFAAGKPATQESSLDVFCHVIFDVNIDVMDVRGRPQEFVAL